MASIHPSRMGLVPHEAADQRERPYSPRRGRDHSPQRSNRRRASPAYDDYAPGTTPPPANVPWKKPENMPPPRQDAYRGGGGGGGGAGAEFLESRRLQREGVKVNIWPSSPKAPRSPSPKHRKRRRDLSVSSSDSSSDEERRRREKKERKRRKEKERAERKEHKHRHRDRSRSRTHHHPDDEEDQRRDRKRRHHSRTRSRSPDRHRDDRRRAPSERADEWTVKHSDRPRSTSVNHAPPRTLSPQDGHDDDEDDFGPQPAVAVQARRDDRSYGGALLRGEGSAMAAFLQDDTDARIPRRGEIGLSSGEIAQYEDAGYVMSGNRHKRMTAVRMRKENQVITTEEKRNLLKLQKEEKERREAILREEFSELVQEKLKSAPGKPE